MWKCGGVAVSAGLALFPQIKQRDQHLLGQEALNRAEF
jgi:hypothetical protein